MVQAWNPMLYLNDTIQYQLSLVEQTWLPMSQYFVILAVIGLFLSIVAKKNIYDRTE